MAKHKSSLLSNLSDHDFKGGSNLSVTPLKSSVQDLSLDIIRVLDELGDLDDFAVPDSDSDSDGAYFSDDDDDNNKDNNKDNDNNSNKQNENEKKETKEENENEKNETNNKNEKVAANTRHPQVNKGNNGKNEINNNVNNVNNDNSNNNFNFGQSRVHQNHRESNISHSDSSDDMADFRNAISMPTRTSLDPTTWSGDNYDQVVQKEMEKAQSKSKNKNDKYDRMIPQPLINATMKNKNKNKQKQKQKQKQQKQQEQENNNNSNNDKTDEKTQREKDIEKEKDKAKGKDKVKDKDKDDSKQNKNNYLVNDGISGFDDSLFNSTNEYDTGMNHRRKDKTDKGKKIDKLDDLPEEEKYINRNISPTLSSPEKRYTSPGHILKQMSSTDFEKIRHKSTMTQLEDQHNEYVNLPELSGWILKLSGKGFGVWQRRWLVVKRTHLLWSKKRQDIVDPLDPKERQKWKNSLTLLTIQEVKPVNSTNARKFDIITNSKTYHFRALSREDRDRWVDGMNQHLHALAKSMTFLRQTFLFGSD